MLQKISPRWPAAFVPLLRSADRGRRIVRRTWAGLWDRRRIRRAGLSMLPPARLRDRVQRVPDLGRFLAGGRHAAERIERALEGLGRPLASFERVLDFGCGCGRTLRWFEPYRETCRFHGTDVDAEAIAWCAAEIPFARFQVNRALPPLDDPDDSFDLIYAISVFTHLDEPRQLLWLEELRRVARPGGIVLLSVHGEGGRERLDDVQRERLRERGFLFVRTDRRKGVFPDWYQVAFHAPDYVREQFGRYFEVVQYLPQGFTRHQDFVALRKTARD
jgi:SAM-dependent methyltransferase